MKKLGVNIDHVATLRQARRGQEPDPIEAAKMCLKAGCDSIVAHLREDRRHIQDKDVFALRQAVKKRLNLEMSIHPDIVDVALRVRPDQVTIVPERRQELTTEGGLDVIKYFKAIEKVVLAFKKRRIPVSLFIAADQRQIDACKVLGVEAIEIHTGTYADSKNHKSRLKELIKIRQMSGYAHQLGLVVNAGHGLDYTNTAAIAAISEIKELNIGHSIVARAVTVGLSQAVKEMIKIMKANRFL